MPANQSSEGSGPGGKSGNVRFTTGAGGLPMLEVETASSSARIYLHGAHVTHFQKRGEPPLLFLSRESRYVDAQPIRGGIPLILPWFGPREGAPAHGVVRTRSWTLQEITAEADGGIGLSFGVDCAASEGFGPFSAAYRVRVGDRLELELSVTNRSADHELTFEACLHTYFSVGDIAAISLAGLKGVTYLDKLANGAEKVETAAALKIASEVDRVYLDRGHCIEIHDPSLGRKILVEKQNSASTVVWNPWIAKSKAMPDFGDEEYVGMVCVESGNVGRDRITLPPGGSSKLLVRLATAPF